jgi:hypothetical protein
VNLITCFPSFCLDDPEQLAASLGPAAWEMAKHSSLRIDDWFSISSGAQADIISILARPVREIAPGEQAITSLFQAGS